MSLIDVLQFLGFQILVILVIIYGISKFVSLFIGKTKYYLKNQNEQFQLFGDVKKSVTVFINEELRTSEEKDYLNRKVKLMIHGSMPR